MTDQPVDLGDAASVKERIKAIKRDKITRDQMIRAVMTIPQGRALIRWILFDICHTDEISFTTNGLTMAFREGERNVGQQIKAELVTRENIDDYFTMLREHENDEITLPST